MKIRLLFLLNLLSIGAYAQMTDGPYVFVRNGRTVQKSLSMKDGRAVVNADSLGKVSEIAVEVSSHPEWTFKVKLRSALSIAKPVSKGASKMLFLSDIEGEFAAFRSILLANGVIDEKYRWTYGQGQLIIAGDLFDRGKEVLPYLWLLYKLEAEGNVHVILGNHDIMNLQGDFRYVAPEYKANAKLMGESYADLFAANTELGRWLRTKNVIEKVGDVLVLHGGVSPAVNKMGWSLNRINNTARSFYTTPMKSLPDSLKDLMGGQGLFWYRGYFSAPKTTMAAVDSTLQLFSAKTILVGHTILAKNIAVYYHGKVIGVDVNQHAGKHNAALLENGQWFLLDDKGSKQPLVYRKENDEVKAGDIN
ncbi:metallophosphoesterase [Mucilaginibacter myungsuensis]|uniref:Metallophosphoesterase n=1 Tax=Mucilaginibacter myungsuensis TaxID=649104 RepID=A0A929L4R5_9SPHI|nr:metallophosphoesterase [Mucilaginibacter myungsuensis]MBE9663211.1 metallophosphoesterase [Mucilaginibacter myungsuensis]MDN3598844.1 metallophosphoesterase [Mucilaginibacter myungsuensis]